jgi:acyl transferase domain-containing protein
MPTAFVPVKLIGIITTSSNGRTPGISLPSGKLQETVMRKAYENAGLNPAGTDYVECHGTGTPVGDPIEVNAVGNCFSPRQGAPLLIGSVRFTTRAEMFETDDNLVIFR